MRILDISPLISEDLAVFPGDTPFSGTKSMEIAKGQHIDLGAMTTTYHIGAHADAPLHYVKGGADAADLPLAAYYGTCEVIEIAIGRGERIRPPHLPATPQAPRVLFKTGTFPDPDDWNDDFAALSTELIDHLNDHGVVLVGIDTPSVDLVDDKILATHEQLQRYGIANLEGLVLAGVAPGLYTLAAFPLKIRRADASPVRAVLIDE